MHAQRPLIDRVIDTQAALEDLRSQFPWLVSWQIDISGGLAGVVGNLLKQLQIILGPHPEIDFLYIAEEAIKGDDYRGRLAVFIEPKTQLAAQRNAIDHFVLKAVNEASLACRCCGGELSHCESGDYPFLPPAKNSIGNRTVLLCLACAHYRWQRDQEAERFLELAQEEADKPFEVGLPITHSSAEEEGGQDEFEDIDIGDEEWEEDETVQAFAEAESEDRVAVEDGEEASLPPTVRVFSLTDMGALKAEQEGANKDREKQIKGLVRKLEQAGPDKRLALQPEGWREYCEELSHLFPNFSAVIAFISRQMALSALKDRALALPPFLLMGPPGIGKTEFLLTLAHDVKGTLEVIDMSAAQTGSALTGSEAYWGNTQTGTLFNVLTLGQVANPIILLDEVDKARKDNAYNPLSALHQLLEPRQAKQFRDLSVPTLPFDASHVIWAATGNTMGEIDKPILDRFVVFEIEAPSAEQMQSIAQNQYRRLVERYGLLDQFGPALSPETLAEITKFKPRQVRKIIEGALGNAAYHSRCYLNAEDVMASRLAMTTMDKCSIGFV